ncbi:MAG: hypothetical protein HFF87_05415 [Oscillibacter sp.]|jgi:uncharacterized membrane protein YkvI|nr:hypothetical protein [Oscillibacter sp.]
MSNQQRIDWKTVFKIGGAYAAYHIGAGFASGQETMQYFGTFGGIYPLVLPLIIFAVVVIYSISNYRVGATEQFEDPNMAFEYYCGSTLGKILNIFTNFTIALTSLVMFAGAGATVNQYIGAPIWVGAVLIGVISAFVVCLGLEKVTNVLGGCGVLIIALMALVGIYSFITADVSIMEGQQRILEYVEQGIFLQAQAFGGHNPILTTISFAGLGLGLILTFNVSLGKSCTNMKTCVASSICAAAFYVIGICTVLFTMLLNLDYIAEIGAKVPMLAAVAKVIPFLELPYTIIVLIGVFTTIAGYLWTVGRRCGEDKSLRQRVVVIVLAAIGTTVGSMIPLDRLVNILFPIMGYIGIVIFVLVVITEVKMKASRKPFPEKAGKETD